MIILTFMKATGFIDTKSKIVDFLATFFYIGYLPYCPGTWSSLTTVILSFFFLRGRNIFFIISLIVLLSIVGVLAATLYDKNHKTHDSENIVIDETVGQLISIIPVFWVNNTNFYYYLLGFVFFRFFDITKVLGINYLQKLPQGYGVMADDIIAGVYSAIILGSILWKFPG